MVMTDEPCGQPRSLKCGRVRSTSPSGTVEEANGSIRRSGVAETSQWDIEEPGSRGFGV
jgi:hypothetical protein